MHPIQFPTMHDSSMRDTFGRCGVVPPDGAQRPRRQLPRRRPPPLQARVPQLLVLLQRLEAVCHERVKGADALPVAEPRMLLDAPVIAPKDGVLDGDHAQLHLVAGERAGLVAEDILDLAQVFVEAAVSAAGVLLGDGALHLGVKVDKGEALTVWVAMGAGYCTVV